MKIRKNFQKQLKNEIDVDQKIFIKNNKLIQKSKQFTSKKHNLFTEEFNKIALCCNNNKRIQSIDSVEAYTYGTRRDLLK